MCDLIFASANIEKIRQKYFAPPKNFPYRYGMRGSKTNIFFESLQ